MSRAQLLWLQSWIALSGSVFWYLPPKLPYTWAVLGVSLAWSLLCLVSIWVEELEDWSYRLSSFLGFLFCTIEGILGLVGATTKSGVLVMATLHGLTFLLSLAGRYQSRVRRRPRRSFEELAELAIADAQARKSSDPTS